MKKLFQKMHQLLVNLRNLIQIKLITLQKKLKFLNHNSQIKKIKVSYKIGILTGSTFIGCAAGIGLLYLKKKNPNKYEELKQKFPEAFTTLKRNVTRSASSIRRGVNRTATSIRRKNNKTEESRHGDHEGYNYREMPEHMFGEDGLPRIKLLDEPVKKDYPEATIEVNLKDN